MERKETNSRRSFFKRAGLGGLITLAAPEILTAAVPEISSKIKLQQDDVILFQGDSITDAGRKKDTKDFNTQGMLGSGYALFAAAELLKNYPGKNFKIYNKGISGNKVYQLAERWDAECLDIKPNVLSILVGVNDFWHTMTNSYKGTIKTYSDDYRALLDRTRQKLPDVKLIIGEPFAVTGVKAVDDKWYPAFNDYRAAARQIATDYKAVLIPYQTVFDKAQKTASGAYWTADGVHPSVAGARLMAAAWLEAVKG